LQVIDTGIGSLPAGASRSSTSSCWKLAQDLHAAAGGHCRKLRLQGSHGMPRNRERPRDIGKARTAQNACPGRKGTGSKAGPDRGEGSIGPDGVAVENGEGGLRCPVAATRAATFVSR
jgi:hypothetical protein